MFKTVRTPCKKEGCNHVFEPYSVKQRSNGAFARCPKCGKFSHLEIDSGNQTSQPGTKGGE